MLFDGLLYVIITFQWRETKSHCGSKQKSVELYVTLWYTALHSWLIQLPVRSAVPVAIPVLQPKSANVSKQTMHVCIVSDIEVLSSL